MCWSIFSLCKHGFLGLRFFLTCIPVYSCFARLCSAYWSSMVGWMIDSYEFITAQWFLTNFVHEYSLWVLVDFFFRVFSDVLMQCFSSGSNGFCEKLGFFPHKESYNSWKRIISSSVWLFRGACSWRSLMSKHGNWLFYSSYFYLTYLCYYCGHLFMWFLLFISMSQYSILIGVIF